MLYGTNNSAITNKENTCAQDGHKSASWWATRAQAIYSTLVPSFSNPCYADVRSRKHLTTSGSQYRLYAGVIDGKEGFQTNPVTMESSESAGHGLFAAGTAGAAGLGNNYPAPGATIGFALDSAYRAAVGAIARAHLINTDKVAKAETISEEQTTTTTKSGRCLLCVGRYNVYHWYWLYFSG